MFEHFIELEDEQDFFNLLINEITIIEKALMYSIENKMVSLLEYMIEKCSKNYLDMHLKEWVIKRLISKSEDNTNKIILRKL
mmetsp:Transcript_22934/g.20382  ORF Transcript_22934/g.20382 Transcript_22934/m.20382 type:complete len:82 (+) Transcript_22934:280-525(+)